MGSAKHPTRIGQFGSVCWVILPRTHVIRLILKDAQSEAHFLWEKQMTEVSSSCGNHVPEIPATSSYKIETQKWTPKKRNIIFA